MARPKLTEEQKEIINNQKLLEGISKGKTPIDNVIKENLQLQTLFDIYNKYNVTPVDENKKPDTDKQTFIKYFNERKKKKDDKVIKKPIADAATIERIKENNKKYEEKQITNALNATKDAAIETGANILYGIGKGVSGSGAGTLGLLQNLAEYGYNKIKDPENTNILDSLSKENFWIKNQNEFDNMLADLLNIKDSYETQDVNDVRQQFIGEFLIPQNYLKKPFNYTAKFFKNPEKAKSAINYLVPGVQFSEGASNAKKLIEFGGQTPVALGFNELLASLGDKQGVITDYGKEEKDERLVKEPKYPKNVTIINDKRRIGKKQFIEDLPKKAVDYYQINKPVIPTWKQYSPFHNESGEVNGIGYTVMSAAGLLGASKVGRTIKSIKQKKLEKVAETIKNSNNPLTQLTEQLGNDTKNNLDTLIASLNSEPRNIRKQLNSFEKLDNTLTDRMNFIDKMKKNNQLSEDALSEVSRDIYSQIDARFSSGILDDGIQTRVSPLFTKQKIILLKAEQPEYYDKLERLLEISSKIQDETNRVNKFKLNREINLSPNEYINARLSKKLKLDTSINYSSDKLLLDLSNEHKNLLKELKEIPQTATIIDEISDISEQMIKVLEKSGMYSDRSIQLMKQNRTFDGLLSYKPRKQLIEETFKDKIVNALFKKQNNTFRASEAFNNIRTEGSIGEGQNFLDLFEHDIKSTLLDIHNNAVTRKFVNDAELYQIKTANRILDSTSDRKISIINNKHNSAEDIITKSHNVDRKVLAQINDVLVVRPLGVEDLDELNKHDTPRSFFNIINRKQTQNDWLSNSLNEIFGESEDKFAKASKNFNNRNDIIAYIDKGKIRYYQVDPIINKAFSSNPELPGLIGKAVKNFRNFRQEMITGKLNPAFAVPSATYTTEEGLIALGKITDELNIAFDKKVISRKEYLKEIKTAFEEIKSQEQAKHLMKIYNEEYVKHFGKSGLLDQKMFEINQEALQRNINNSLLTKIQLAGGASSKPFNVNTGIYYTLSKDNKISDKVKELIIKNNTVNNSTKLINMIDYVQTALREAPNIGLVQYLGKKTGAIVDNNIVDSKKFDEVLRVTSKYVANLGKRGSHLGYIGSLGKAIEDYAPYGHVMLQSLAPKLRGIGLGKGLSNIKDDISMLFDPNVAYSEVFDMIKNQIKGAAGNKYIQAVITGATIPAIMSYAWNYSNQENTDAFHGISDYDKSSKIFLANAFGKDKHLFIPMDQEYAIAYALTYNLLDSMLGMSAYNQNDPAFNNNKLVLDALSRSLFIDEVAGIETLSAIFGKKLNINPLDDRFGINNTKKDIINPDLDETAYENGVFNNYALNIFETIFGVIGRSFTDAIEEGVVGSRNDTALSDASQAVLSNMFNSAKLINNKFTSYNETSKYVYDKIVTITKLAATSKDFNEQQNEVYNLVKAYRNNRITPIHKQITQLLKMKNHIKANGYIDGEKVSLDYQGRKLKVQDIDKIIAKLFALEYYEYQDLDKIIEQEFGKGLNLENFAEQLRSI